MTSSRTFARWAFVSPATAFLLTALEHAAVTRDKRRPKLAKGRRPWPPGHNVRVDADAEIVMFSPQREHSHVIEHMIEKVGG